MDPQKLDEYVQAMVGTVSLRTNRDVVFVFLFILVVFFSCLLNVIDWLT